MLTASFDYVCPDVTVCTGRGEGEGNIDRLGGTASVAAPGLKLVIWYRGRGGVGWGMRCFGSHFDICDAFLVYLSEAYLLLGA